MPCIGTLALAGSLLELLPSHQGDRFPRSTQAPVLRSCLLHAGCHLGSKQVTPRLIPGQRRPPGFDNIPTLSTIQQRFACAHLRSTHLTESSPAFSTTLTTMALDHRSLWWFEASSCKAAPRDQQTLITCATRTVCCSRSNQRSWRTVIGIPTEWNSFVSRG